MVRLRLLAFLVGGGATLHSAWCKPQGRLVNRLKRREHSLVRYITILLSRTEDEKLQGLGKAAWK